MGAIYNGEFQAASFLGRAHSMHVWGRFEEAEQWMLNAKRMFMASNIDVTDKENEEQWRTFFNYVLDLAYKLTDEEFISEIEWCYGEHENKLPENIRPEWM